jgi:hypothetical protein
MDSVTAVVTVCVVIHHNMELVMETVVVVYYSMHFEIVDTTEDSVDMTEDFEIVDTTEDFEIVDTTEEFDMTDDKTQLVYNKLLEGNNQKLYCGNYLLEGI